MAPGGEPQKVAVRIADDGRHDIDKVVPVNDGFTEATLSPNGKEFAYVFRGEIFVSQHRDGGITKRITNTPWQERERALQPRRPVAGLRRRAGQQLGRVQDVDRPQGRAVLLRVHACSRRTPVVATAAEEYQPTFSPDGKEVAYLEEPRGAQGDQPRHEADPHHPDRRPQLLVRRRRPVLRLVARRQVVPGVVRAARADLHPRRSAWSRPTARARSTT